ncbi:glycosyltransferase, partial [Photobacterium phosphoreum]|uniref:glycosyltransferase n=1 Tax=Photobacterium phosphoreum TaxID=659 RepID=UPI000D4ED6AC
DWSSAASDVYKQQLEMMSAGKIVFTGSTELGKSYFDFMGITPAQDASPNADILFHSINSLLDNKSKLSELSLRGREYIMLNHDVTNVAGKFLNLWNN